MRSSANYSKHDPFLLGSGSSNSGSWSWRERVLLADFDSDGNLDVFVATRRSNQLYRGLGQGAFEELTGSALSADDVISMFAACADYDGDGHPDVFVVSYPSFLPLCEAFSLHTTIPPAPLASARVPMSGVFFSPVCRANSPKLHVFTSETSPRLDPPPASVCLSNSGASPPYSHIDGRWLRCRALPCRRIRVFQTTSSATPALISSRSRAQ